ncbi:unnamed protein product [Didymodactylos carnosus]|uniref:Uncharacterized protein n=1 Tax=Didymodactylos carnosus TaxID=1234261 RepID=A0A815ZEG6_9BILA|nr:unnamed protein product [Didymodactylos carnosus]CAF1678587.1 unnamed protein product [Didymodactylos carnosus]CAF4451267.1 unnamed protein product [Didymodactylos carnosus]CAF4566254.1 unnamed protein product [Didymodactylos carnosus]
MHWIFFEAGPGKGVADAVGATTKRLFDDTTKFNPDETYSNAMDLMTHTENSTKIQLFSYVKQDIDEIRQQIPPLATVHDTSLFHEVIAKPNDEVYAKNKSDEEE